jgi:hypothetical protein
VIDMSKAVIGALVFVALIGGLVAVLFLGGEEASAPSASGQNNEEPLATEALVNDEDTTETDASTSDDSISEAEVAAKATADECWTIIDGSVYDITAYIPRHPGGETILAACGTDGTSLFTERTSDNGEEVGSGTPHSSNATAQLESFKIGELAN